MRRRTRNSSTDTQQYVLEEKRIETMFDLTDEKRERLFQVTRELASVLQVNATRRIIHIQFKNFHAESAKRADFNKITDTLTELATQ